MRSLRAPVPDADLKDLPDTLAGETLFKQVGCDHCHTPKYVTAAEGMLLNGGKFIVPAALASKTIKPYGDFMLHDVGTGDGIVQNGGPATRNMVRTAPLWGLRTRSRLMHDGASLTPRDAILRHAGQAATVIASYSALTLEQRQQIFDFLDSL